MMPDQLSSRPVEGNGPAALASSPHEALLALRSRAEKRRHLVTQVATQHSLEETQRLVQELQVHQIELEMQYEELLLAQTEAQKVRTEYEDLYDFAPIGYFTLTAAGIIEQLNLCGSRQLGTVRQRLVGRRFALFVAPSHRAEFGQFLAEVTSSNTTRSREMVLQREDGSPFYAQLEGLFASGSPNIESAGQCRIAVIDTTLRRQAVDALAASEARFRQLFTESHDAVVLMEGHTYVDCNNAALRLLGATHKQQVVGRPAWAHAPDVQPDGRRTSDLFLRMVELAIRTGSQRCIALMHKVTGEEIWVEAVLTPIEQEGDKPLVHILWRDVTAERQAAELLRESQTRLSLALDASQTGIFTWELATNELRWDERAQAVFGYRTYDPSPMPVEGLANSFHPDDKARVWTATQEAITSGAPLALDYRVVWPDGSVHYASSAGRAVKNAQGQVQAFAGVLRDVTALYAAEEELHYKTLVLERLLSNMPMVLSRFRPDGLYLEAVGAGLRALGVEDNTLVGRNAFEVFPNLHVPLLDVFDGKQVRFVAELIATGQPTIFQNYGFFDEQRQQAVVLSVDVTETEQQRKQLQAERDFTQSLLENSVDGIAAIDRTGRVTAWNSQAAEYFGPSAAAALGRPIFELIPSLNCDEARAVVGRVLAGEPILLTGQTFEHRVGHYDAYHVPLRQQGEVTGVLVIFRDVTERDRLAEEATRLRLRQQQAVLSAILTTQETERKRIAEALHNGLGQLLYAAKLSLEVQANTPASYGGALKLLHEAIHTTRTISFELTPGILEDFGLRTSLEELIKRIAPSGLRVELHHAGLEGRLPAAIEIAVYRIVQELLNNVMKHAQGTEVIVHVAHEDGCIEVTVEDNGRGFDSAALAAGPLAGIGLAGVRNRVALLGGELSVNSRPGLGTIISFELAVDAVG